MKWEKYLDDKMESIEHIYENKTKQTDIECPVCGKYVRVRNDIVFASNPPRHKYECECGWVGYA